MDSFFGIGLFELIMIAVVALLVLGPERLPGAMREVAKWMRQLRNLSSDFQSQFSEEFKLLDEMNPRRIINEAIDPKTPTKPSTSSSSKSTTPQTPAKPLAPKSVTPSAPKPVKTALPAATAVAVTNGETQNTILPPKAEQEVLEPPPAEAAEQTSVDLLADASAREDQPAEDQPAADDQKLEAAQ